MQDPQFGSRRGRSRHKSDGGRRVSGSRRGHADNQEASTRQDRDFSDGHEDDEWVAEDGDNGARRSGGDRRSSRTRYRDRSYSGNGESRSLRGDGTRGNTPPPSVGSSPRRRGSERMSEHDLSRYEQRSSERTPSHYRHERGRRSGDSRIGRRGPAQEFEDDVSETQPLIRHRQRSHGQGDRNTQQGHTQEMSLLGHIFQFGRLALKSQHPDFPKGSPRTIKVLREAAEISRPLLEMVKEDLEEREERKGEGKGGVKGKVMNEGVKWIERQIEVAEKDLRRLERRQEREACGGGKGKRKHGNKKKHPKEGKGERGNWKAHRRGHSPSASDDGQFGEEYGCGALPAPEPDTEHEHFLEEHRDSDRGSSAGQRPGASQADQPGYPERQSRHSRSSQHQSQRPTTSSGDGESGHRSSQHSQRPYDESQYSFMPSARPDRPGAQQAQVHTSSSRSHRSRNSRRSNAGRPAHEQHQHQKAPTEACSGEGLAADYYNSFDRSASGASPALHPRRRSSSTLRPEDSGTLRDWPSPDSAAPREEARSQRNRMRRQERGQSNAGDPALRTSSRQPNPARKHADTHQDRRGYRSRRIADVLPAPPIGPGRARDGGDGDDSNGSFGMPRPV